MNGNAILAKYGLVVYDKPTPHIPLEDLKLALGSEKYDAFMRYTHKFVSDGKGVIGIAPESVANILQLV